MKDLKSTKKPVTDPKISRRGFITKTALATGAVTILPRHIFGRGFVAPSDRINLGFIGLGKQSRGLAKNFVGATNSQIVAACDVWSTKNEWFKGAVNAIYAEKRKQNNYNGVTTYTNYNELLDRKDVDAVVIATPDHWHAIQAIDAMKAGKDVYCEKPLTHNINEGIDLVKTVKKTNKILQTGSMQRSGKNFRRACELVRNGYLGDIKQVLVNVGDPAVPYNLQPETLPAEVNWNKWCGPAPLLGYNHRLAPSRNDVDFWPDWRLYEEVGGGILCDWGAHMFDIVQWALGMDRSGPVKYVPPTDKKAVKGLKMYYDNGVEMIHEDFGRGWGVRFIGSKGTMDISRSYFETTPKNLVSAELTASDIKLYNTEGNHYQDWISSIKNRTQPICDAETGHRSATVCNIANIAYNLGRPLDWDPVKEKFLGDNQANKMRGRKERKF
ncbi:MULTISPECIES: Gfo/Idh/MocA family protein [unclassified Cellulophaga]|uniref:Gfo/Idh/MocA family protein n=1 Tax=unclassified Cellulophaga TaxID=2634405 RepID=UPI0026E40F92|nr:MULTISPECIES: Gfo/Idh/MocA family oxidoreductase [unclassified Cellulophaga]MDO6492673.1 Gfo/Idh/MocA family oxidoreductase [Cellulophaga sp. 2_MG-2023]MDO6495930.1 Gfo/Idh/MocA family oxidoreductase [Cellulophaga sp. 3_MG-2023]